jgi:O-methyltransferase involved in polyketide biosynthesis
MEEAGIKLGHVQQTLLFPLWGRAIESMNKNPKLIDKTAEEIVNKVPYNFTKIDKNISSVSKHSWIARSLYFDNRLMMYLAQYPEATIINVGCGFDTTFERVDNGTLHWFDIDLPDVIELRRKYIEDSERRKAFGYSILSNEWYSKIAKREHILFLMAGVIYYFSEDDIKNLFYNIKVEFSSFELLFDYCSMKGVEMANKRVIAQGGMTQSSNLVWGTNNIQEMLNWNMNIEILHDMPMFKEFRKEYPVHKKIGMLMSDKMKIMSLCHIKLS